MIQQKCHSLPQVPVVTSAGGPVVTTASGVTMPPKVKKVMIPPMVRKAGGAPAGGAPITVTKGGVRIPGKIVEEISSPLSLLPSFILLNEISSALVSEFGHWRSVGRSMAVPPQFLARLAVQL